MTFPASFLAFSPTFLPFPLLFQGFFSRFLAIFLHFYVFADVYPSFTQVSFKVRKTNEQSHFEPWHLHERLHFSLEEERVCIALWVNDCDARRERPLFHAYHATPSTTTNSRVLPGSSGKLDFPCKAKKP